MLEASEIVHQLGCSLAHLVCFRRRTAPQGRHLAGAEEARFQAALAVLRNTALLG